MDEFHDREELRAAFFGMFRSLDCLFVNHPGRDQDCLFQW
jgi:hypothetical protein